MEPIIHVKDLRKVYRTHKRGSGVVNALKSLVRRKYESKEALKGISFEIKKGEIVGLIGPNGAGKSTTIKALAGVLVPTSGFINVLNFIPWKDRIRYVKNIGVVFGQKEQLYWDLPALDTFYLHKEVYDIPDKEFRQRLRHMVDILSIHEIIKIPVRDLSLGERMKCKLVAALLHNPPLVFLDEPTIGLDAIAKEKMRQFIKDVNRAQGTTFVITTHDMDDIEKLCKRVIIIDLGKIIYDGFLANIRERIAKHKIIDVRLEHAGKFSFPNCKIVKKANNELKIEVDTKRQGIKQVIDYLITKYKVEDIIISEPPIEEIIQLVYKQSKGGTHGNR